MPFTPYHFGPGLALKGVARPVFSMSAFVAAQVFVDFEPLYHMLRHEYPVHGFFHTFIGATIAGLTGAGAWLLVARLLEFTFPTLMKSAISSTTAQSEVSVRGVLLGGLAGGISHPLLDGIVHSDVHPLAPFSNQNPFLDIVSGGTLEFLCVIAAFLGAVALIKGKSK